MEETIRKYIADELRSLRAKNNISLVELANILKINKDTISRYENASSSINIDTLETFLNYYNIDFDIFFSNVCANKYSQLQKEET
jgi:transcriptional regulator with XRE-family HTH domain